MTQGWSTYDDLEILGLKRFDGAFHLGARVLQLQRPLNPFFDVPLVRAKDADRHFNRQIG